MEHRESRSIIMGTIALTVVFAALLIATPGYSPDLTTMARSLFNAASLVATSGMQSEAGVFILLPYSAVLFIMLIGGSAYATAGGVKALPGVGHALPNRGRNSTSWCFPTPSNRRISAAQQADMPVMRAIWSFLHRRAGVVIASAPFS